MNDPKDQICEKCKKIKILITFWEGEKKIYEYWICDCKENK